MSDPAQTVTPEIKSCATCGDDKTGLRLTGGAPKRYFCTNRTCPDFGTELVLSEWNRRVKSDLLLPSPSEREELASVISHAINFDDGAHHLSMGDDGEPCRACQDVADAVLFAGYFKRSSPSSAGQEVREAVRDVLTELADECKVEYFQNFITKYGVRAAIKSFRDEQYPALSAGETETRT